MKIMQKRAGEFLRISGGFNASELPAEPVVAPIIEAERQIERLPVRRGSLKQCVELTRPVRLDR